MGEAARRMRGAALVAALVSALSTLLLVATLVMPARSLDSSLSPRYDESESSSLRRNRRVLNLDAFADPKSVEGRSSNAVDGLSFQPIRFEERPVSRNVLGTIYAPTLHDKNYSLYEQDYRSTIEDWVVRMHGAGPPLVINFEYIPSETETYYAVWGWGRGRIEGSVWRVGGSQAEYLDAYSYVDPRGHDLESAPVLAVDGDRKSNLSEGARLPLALINLLYQTPHFTAGIRPHTDMF